MTDDPIEPLKRPRRRRRRFGLWMLLSIAFLLALLGLAGLSVTGRSLTAPAWITDQAIRRVNDSFEQGRISLGQLALEVDDRGVPRLVLRNVGIFDARGVEVARLNNVGARFSLRTLLEGRFEPDVLRLNGAQIVVRRRADGQFDLTFGAVSGASGSLPVVLDEVERIFASSPLKAINLIEAGDLTITVEDARSGRFWQVTEGRLQIRQDQDSLDYAISFDIFNGTDDLARMVLGLHTDKRDSSASLTTTFENAAAGDIALQSPVLSFLGVLDAPIAGAVRAEFLPTGSLGSLAGSLEIAAGALQPSPQTTPIGFESGKVYFRYNPALDQIRFSEVSVVTEAGRALGSGQAYLQDYRNGWPSSLLGQFSLSELQAEAEGLFPAPVRFSEGAVDFRMRLSPFELDIGQLYLAEGSDRLHAKGSVRAGPKGWEAAVDIGTDALARERLLALWPVNFGAKTQAWVQQNVSSGDLFNIHAAVRTAAGEKPRVGLSFEFSDATVRFLKTLPEITGGSGYASFDDYAFSVALEKGVVVAPLGGSVDLAGTTYRIKDTRVKPPIAVLNLQGTSSITAALSLLNEPPFNILRKSTLPVELAKGRTAFRAEAQFETRKGLTPRDVAYSVTADLLDVTSDVLVKGRALSAVRLSLTATPEKVAISGPARVGAAAVSMSWEKRAAPAETGKSQVFGTVALSRPFLDEFSINLPESMVAGTGTGRFQIELETGVAPHFDLETDLTGISLNIAALGWRKAANAAGRLQVSGALGAAPAIEGLSLSAPGLDATGGQVTLSEAGQLQTASFDRIQVGGWLDAPITLTGRGAGVAPAIAIRGGTADIRNATFGTGGQGAGSSPIQLSLDRLILSEGITLFGLTGTIGGGADTEGSFTGKVNGGAVIEGSLVPSANGSTIRISSDDAGRVLRDAGVFRNALGGTMNLSLRPRAERGVYGGQLSVTNTRVVNAPALTELLSAISIVGLLDQLSGPGIAFSTVEAAFRLSPRSVTLTKSSAIGPSLGVSLDGVYDLRTKQMDFQGVMSPIYFLNGIGQIFSKKGEGLFGFNFRLTGATDAPVVRVNPLSILTPGMFRDIFRSPAPAPIR